MHRSESLRDVLTKKAGVSSDHGLKLAWDSMDVLEMATKVAALSECFHALRAMEGPKTRMLAEVITEVARFLERAFTARVLTNEE